MGKSEVLTVPKKIKLYRIIHINNLEYILKKRKLTSNKHQERDPNYIGIGDVDLKNRRRYWTIPIEPMTDYTHYVAFYFGSRSPMLYQIQTGYEGVKKYSPNDIIYLVTTLDAIKEANGEYLFTDGHGYDRRTKFYRHDNDLIHVPWDCIDERIWNNTSENPDRKRKKQAEFLVLNQVLLSSIRGIGVNCKDTYNHVQQIITKYNHQLPVLIRKDWYY